MYLGKIVEMGPSHHVFDHPAHPYTQALVSAIPGHGPRIRLAGEVQSPINPPPQVCRFASRCPAAQDRCVREAPVLHGPTGNSGNSGTSGTSGSSGSSGTSGNSDHRAACHFAQWPAPVSA